MEMNLYKNHRTAFKVLSVSLHAIGAAQFWFGCYYDWFYVIVPKQVMPIYSAFGYKLKFLTYWDALLQSVYFTFCLGNDILELFSSREDNSSSCAVKTKNFMYAAFAFPISMFVGVTFWGLMAVDRELVLPAKLDPYFPSWLNHIMHTNIVLFQLLETISSPRDYPKRAFGIPALFAFQAAYLSWMYIVHSESGMWVYPVFDVLSTPLRILFLGGCFCAGFVFYYFGERVNCCLWEEARGTRSHQNVKYTR